MLSVCVSTFITCAILCHKPLCNCSLLAAFGVLYAKQQQVSIIVLCCPDGKKVDDILLLQDTATNYQAAVLCVPLLILFIQDETDSLLQLQLAWPTCY